MNDLNASQSRASLIRDVRVEVDTIIPPMLNQMSELRQGAHDLLHDMQDMQGQMKTLEADIQTYRSNMLRRLRNIDTLLTPLLDSPLPDSL